MSRVNAGSLKVAKMWSAVSSAGSVVKLSGIVRRPGLGGEGVGSVRWRRAGLDKGRLGPQRSRAQGAYTQIEGEIRLIRTGNTAQNA